MKLFELCKTRNKKSSPDLIKFYVISAGHGISMTMTGLPRAGGISKLRDYKQNVQKMKGLLKKWTLTGNSLKNSNQKNQKVQSSYGEQNKRTTRPQGQKLNKNHVARKNLT